MPRDCSVEVVDVVRSEDVDGEGMSRVKWFIHGEQREVGVSKGSESISNEASSQD